eukprot:TRINITY_DN44726_c0_g1_i1.p1 TRINITY_DN44726_c0_g1~~TRINITY_DN44726_c0_g1_i1.p1  ORF type:complete len:690 (+),score=114.48 TRINITY_DN44726_c0_g1_i1:63-2132(+)
MAAVSSVPWMPRRRMSAWRVWLAISSAGLASAAAAKRTRIDPTTGHFVDPDGRVLVFHGVNVVQKNFPWHPSRGEFNTRNSLIAGDMVNLSSWGLNAVRLGMMWPGVEPQDGVFNETYLTVMRDLVDELHSHGIYTIVDFHQDSLSEQFCGEGVPAWMVPQLKPFATSCNTGVLPWVAKLIGQCKPFSEFNLSTDPKTGFPNIQDCLKVTFDQYSRTPELTSAWGHFYHDAAIQAKFRRYWTKVAQTFAGSAGVLGYDLVNEPLNGNFYEHAHNLLPGWFDEHVLQPMYQALHQAIATADPDAISFYEPPPFPDSYPSYVGPIGGVYPVGFTEGPAGKDISKQSLSYHYYSCGFALGNCARTGDTPERECKACDDFAAKKVSKREADRQRLGGAAFLTEFGACSESDKCVAEIHRILRQADPAFHSWAYWQFKFFHDITTVSGPIESFYTAEGALQKRKVGALSRTYSPAIAGRPLFTSFDPETAAYRLTYAATAATAKLKTRVYFNEDYNYPRLPKAPGYKLRVINGSVADNGQNHFEVLAASAESLVDVAMVRTRTSNTSGVLPMKDHQRVSWKVLDDAQALDIVFSSNVDAWRSLRVFSDDGAMVCELTSEKAGSPEAACKLGEELQHQFLFAYRLEVWKAGIFGIKEHSDTIPFEYFGPLLNTRIEITLSASSTQPGLEDVEVVV